MDKDCTLENYKFITGQLSSLICIQMLIEEEYSQMLPLMNLNTEW